MSGIISTRSMALLFGVLGAGAVIFMAIVVFPAGNLMRKEVTGEGIVISSSGNRCIVDTNDLALSSKTVENCNLPVGTKVIVRYKESMSEAYIVSQP